MVRHGFAVPVCREGKRRVAAAVWASLTGLAVILVWRRLAGTFSEQVPAAIACAATTFAVLLSLMAWYLDRSMLRAASVPGGRLSAGLLTLLPPFALGVSLLPNESVTALSYHVALFLLAAAAMMTLDETAGWLAHLAPRDSWRTQWGWTHRPPQPPHVLGPTVLQSMTRTASDDGAERIDGRIQIRFAPGQQQTVIHLAFCPPLSGTPEVTCNAPHDSPARLKVALARPYGARIEARRSQATEMPLTVDVGYSAVSVSAQSDAT